MDNKIIYLLKNSEQEIEMLKKSLELLSVNFIPNNNYPIYVFYNEDIDDSIFSAIENFSGLKINPYKISFETEEYLKNINDSIDEYITVEGVPKKFSIGYRHMCRFYSYGMYDLEELKGTDYYLRLDCDSYITSKIDYDLFELMSSKDYIYGYNKITTDNPVVCKNLWEISKEYSLENKTLKTPIDEIQKYNLYYTNFEIARFDWFKNSDYKNYFKFLDKYNGIYKYRWGDHVIKYLGIEMFLDDNKKHWFNIPYRHGNIFNL